MLSKTKANPNQWVLTCSSSVACLMAVEAAYRFLQTCCRFHHAISMPCLSPLIDFGTPMNCLWCSRLERTNSLHHSIRAASICTLSRASISSSAFANHKESYEGRSFEGYCVSRFKVNKIGGKDQTMHSSSTHQRRNKGLPDLSIIRLRKQVVLAWDLKAEEAAFAALTVSWTLQYSCKSLRSRSGASSSRFHSSLSSIPSLEPAANRFQSCALSQKSRWHAFFVKLSPGIMAGWYSPFPQILPSEKWVNSSVSHLDRDAPG